MKHKIHLLMDSGAFSAWRKNKPIDVGEYIDFLLEFKKYFHSYVALDVIPGVVGSIGTPRSIEDSAKKTHKNLTAMRKQGLHPIAVYHMGERRYWLEKLVKEGCKYIGLGGVARVPEEMRRPWLDSVFEYLCGSGGYPETKVHGFGVTSIEAVHRYPWFSIDSVSWRLHSAYGWAVVPDRKIADTSQHLRGGEIEWEYDYKKTPLQIYLSMGNDKGVVHNAARTNQHIFKMGESMRKYVLKYLEDEGWDFKEARTDSTLRTNISVRFYKESGRRFTYKPFTRVCSGLLDLLGPGGKLAGSKTPPKKLQMFFGTSPSRHLLNSLSTENIRHILLSYIYFRKKKTPPLDIPHFVETGDIKGR